MDSSESLRLIMQYSPREEGAGMRCQIMSTWSWSESSLSWQQPGVKTDQRLWGEWGQGDLKWHIRGVWHGIMMKSELENFCEAYGKGKAQSLSSVPRYDFILNQSLSQYPTFMLPSWCKWIKAGIRFSHHKYNFQRKDFRAIGFSCTTCIA